MHVPNRSTSITSGAQPIALRDDAAWPRPPGALPAGAWQALDALIQEALDLGEALELGGVEGGLNSESQVRICPASRPLSSLQGLEREEAQHVGGGGSERASCGRRAPTSRSPGSSAFPTESGNQSVDGGALRKAWLWLL